MSKVSVKAPIKQKIDKKTWKLIATCPVCNILLKEDEKYKIGWILKTDDNRYLSIRGHPDCWEQFYTRGG